MPIARLKRMQEVSGTTPNGVDLRHLALKDYCARSNYSSARVDQNITLVQQLQQLELN